METFIFKEFPGWALAGTSDSKNTSSINSNLSPSGAYSLQSASPLLYDPVLSNALQIAPEKGQTSPISQMSSAMLQEPADLPKPVLARRDTGGTATQSIGA